MFAILEGYGEEKMSDEVGRIRQRRTDLERDLEEVERGLRVNYETEISASRVLEVCDRLSSVIENATREDWRGLMRDFNFKIILQPKQPHLMRVSVQVQEPCEVVNHGS